MRKQGVCTGDGLFRVLRVQFVINFPLFSAMAYRRGAVKVSSGIPGLARLMRQ